MTAKQVSLKDLNRLPRREGRGDSRSLFADEAFRLSPLGLGLFLACSLTLPGQVRAMSLGEMEVQSFLGEPLRVVIPLEMQDPLPARDCIRVLPVDDAALREAYATRIGLTETARGVAIVVTTGRAMREPAMTLGIEVSCNGRQRRDYAVLLDPPLVEPTLIADSSPTLSDPVPAQNSSDTGHEASKPPTPSRNVSSEQRPKPPSVARTQEAAPRVRTPRAVTTTAAARPDAKPRLAVSRAAQGTPAPTLEDLQVEIVVLEKKLLHLRSKLRESGVTDLAAFTSEGTSPGAHDAPVSSDQQPQPVLLASSSLQAGILPRDAALANDVVKTTSDVVSTAPKLEVGNGRFAASASPPLWQMVLGGLLAFGFGVGTMTAWTRWRERSKWPPLPAFARHPDDDRAALEGE